PKQARDVPERNTAHAPDAAATSIADSLPGAVTDSDTAPAAVPDPGAAGSRQFGPGPLTAAGWARPDILSDARADSDPGFGVKRSERHRAVEACADARTASDSNALIGSQALSSAQARPETGFVLGDGLLRQGVLDAQ